MVRRTVLQVPIARIIVGNEIEELLKDDVQVDSFPGGDFNVRFCKRFITLTAYLKVVRTRSQIGKNIGAMTVRSGKGDYPPAIVFLENGDYGPEQAFTFRAGNLACYPASGLPP